MSKFKVGDKVIRTKSIYGGMKVGDTATIISITKNGSIELDKYNKGGGHAPYNLELVPEWDE